MRQLYELVVSLVFHTHSHSATLGMFFPNSFTVNFWLSLFGTLLFIGLASSLPALQIYRYWRVSTPLERQQTKWVVFAFATGFALGFVPYILTLIVPPLDQPGSLYPLLFNPDVSSNHNKS